MTTLAPPRTIEYDTTLAPGTRVTVAGHGPGTVTEALPATRDWRGDVRTPYRVALDSGGEFLAHPESLQVIA